MVLQLQHAFDSEDPQQAERALANPFIRHMDVEYSKLARLVPIPKGMEAIENAARPQAATVPASLNLDNIRAIDDDAS